MANTNVEAGQHTEVDRRLTVRIPAQLAQQAERLAKAEDRSLGSLIRIALADYLNHP